MEQKGEIFGYVSPQTPLISNLTISENISLILEAKYHIKRIEAQNLAIKLLKRVNLSQIISRRPAYCDHYEIFVAQFIRASMVRDAKIAIITPIEFLLEVDIIDLSRDLISKLELKQEVIIFDLYIHLKNYQDRGLLCHIVK